MGLFSLKKFIPDHHWSMKKMRGEDVADMVCCCLLHFFWDLKVWCTSRRWFLLLRYLLIYTGGQEGRGGGLEHNSFFLDKFVWSSCNPLQKNSNLPPCRTQTNYLTVYLFFLKWLSMLRKNNGVALLKPSLNFWQDPKGTFVWDHNDYVLICVCK